MVAPLLALLARYNIKEFQKSFIMILKEAKTNPRQHDPNLLLCILFADDYNNITAFEKQAIVEEEIEVVLPNPYIQRLVARGMMLLIKKVGK